jgi:hypothetical protein
LAFNFNNDAAGGPPPPGAGTGASPATPEGDAGAAAQSPAVSRFNTCRWQQPAEAGNTAFCTHREVKSLAGTTAFDAEAWCPECKFYKLRRTPKKRDRNDYMY